MLKSLCLSTLWLLLLFFGCISTSENVIYKNVLNTPKNWVVEQQPKEHQSLKTIY